MEIIKRPRRLRGGEYLRKMVRETRMDKSSLIYPLFVQEGMGREDEIGSMMIKIGYWDKDWIIDRDVDQCDYLDASDLLIIYMVRFRNCLLGEWAKKQGKEEKTPRYVP